MDKPQMILGKSRNTFWFVISVSFLFWVLLLCMFNSLFFINDTDDRPLMLSDYYALSNSTTIPTEKTQEISQQNREIITQPVIVSDVSFETEPIIPIVEESEVDSCKGRYIYVHDLPSNFNSDLIKNCDSLSSWMDMCPYTTNSGLGPQLPKTEKIFSRNGWFDTNQFLLEVIFHNRMKQYKCLTKNSSMASAIFIPYYVGLDVARFLWSDNQTLKDQNSIELINWVSEKVEWRKMWGRDHFFVGGRITWDFRRMTDDVSVWGSKLMLLPEVKNMTVLLIESSPWNRTDVAIPYPTYFHPSNDQDVFEWQSRMRRMKRRNLFSFVGGRRPDSDASIRNEIFDQCQASKRKCRLLECSPRMNKCYKPVYVMKMFQSSVFCLQPTGDSLTRRSTFDAILAGCIPVFFHPGSAYVQYFWYFPKEYEKYSVFISANEIKERRVSIERVLQRIPKQEVIAMRREVINLIPKVVYADPRFKLESLEDAFDIAVKGVLERIEKIRVEMEEGRDSRYDFGEENTWKYNLFGNAQKHVWDPFFYENSI